MYRGNDFDTYGTKTALYSFSRQMTHPLLSSAPTYFSKKLYSAWIPQELGRKTVYLQYLGIDAVQLQ